MKRDPALVPLTSDHHHALAQARRLRRAAAGEAVPRHEAATAFVAFFDAGTIPHFREEEELLFPLLVEAAQAVPEVLERVLVEHVQIHALLRQVRAGVLAGSVEPGLMRQVAERLEAHIRLEEKELFPLIEEAVPAPALAELALRARRHPEDQPDS